MVRLFYLLLIALISGLALFLMPKALPITSSPSPSSAPVSVPPLPAAPLPLQKFVHLQVPFTSQAPLGEWQDPRQQDACEEAAALMTVKWARNQVITSKEAAREEILQISRFQEETYGEYKDTSAQDTLERIFRTYFQYNLAELATVHSPDDIVQELNRGNLVITPMNGRALLNPYFTPPGPERHMVVAIGYDLEKEQLITNDPGISQGKDYRYTFSVFFNAIRDYPSGYHVPIITVEKKMIVIRPE